MPKKARTPNPAPIAKGPIAPRTGIGAGLVGVGGGYVLARPISEITVFDIISVFDQPRAGGHCLLDSSAQYGDVSAYGAAQPGGRTYAVGVSRPIAVTDGGAVADADAFARARRSTCAYVRRALPGLDPRPVGQVPVDGQFDTLLETHARLVAELVTNQRRIDGVPEIVPGC